jgi:hypothetical protein
MAVTALSALIRERPEAGATMELSADRDDELELGFNTIPVQPKGSFQRVLKPINPNLALD